MVAGCAPGNRELAQHPPVGDGVVQHDRIPIVARLAYAAKTPPERIDIGGAVERGAGLAEYLESDIDHLHVVVGTDVTVSIGWIVPPVIVDALEVAQRRRHRQGRIATPKGALDNRVLHARTHR